MSANQHRQGFIALLVLYFLATFAEPLTAQGQLSLTSPDFQPDQPIPEKFSKAGENISPTLKIKAPSDPRIKSYALVMNDPDAPNKNWVHWVMWNMDAEAEEFSSADPPDGSRLGTNSWGHVGYSGPAPPPGPPHRYVFTLYALDIVFPDLPPSTTAWHLRTRIRGHIVAETTLTGTYQAK